MKKLGFAVAALVATAPAHAALNLILNNPYQSVNQPLAGTTSVVFSGTVDVLLPFFDVTGATIELPGSTSNVFLNVNADPGFVAYIAGNNPGVDYTGTLFTVDVSNTTPIDFYWLNNGGTGPLSEFIVSGIGLDRDASDNEFFGVDVLNPVPEPATLAVLGLGAIGLMRRRRR